MAEAQAWVERKLAEIKCSDQPSCIFFTDASAQTPVGTAAAAIVMLPAASSAGTVTLADQAVTISERVNNDTAELAAVAMACYQFCHVREQVPEMQTLHVFSDSKYVEGLFFSGNASVSNKVSGDALRWVMLQLWLVFQAGCQVVFHWIPGHCGIKHNERADELAKSELASFLTHMPD